MEHGQLDAVCAEIAKIEQSEFVEYGGGWHDEIGTALVDAVYSIRARYQVKDPTKGVLGRVKAFRSRHPEAVNDLRVLLELGEAEIRAIMGSTTTAKRHKSECVVDAARQLLALEPSIVTTADLKSADPRAVKRAYTSVPGLGWVTCEYFQMLLGIPGVKADTMIVRFVNSALEAAGFDGVDNVGARKLVVAAYELDSRGVSLNAYDHAIWRAKGELVVEDDPNA